MEERNENGIGRDRQYGSREGMKGKIHSRKRIVERTSHMLHKRKPKRYHLGIT